MRKMNEKYSNGQVVTSQTGNTLTYYFENGEIKAQGEYLDGKMEGKWLFYKKEGYLWNIGHFKNNQKHGKWIRFKPDGSIEKEENFDVGKKIS